MHINGVILKHEKNINSRLDIPPNRQSITRKSMTRKITRARVIIYTRGPIRKVYAGVVTMCFHNVGKDSSSSSRKVPSGFPLGFVLHPLHSSVCTSVPSAATWFPSLPPRFEVHPGFTPEVGCTRYLHSHCFIMSLFHSRHTTCISLCFFFILWVGYPHFSHSFIIPFAFSTFFTLHFC